MTPEPKQGLLRSKSDSNLSFELNSMIPRSAPHMRRGSPYQKVAVNIPRFGLVDVKAVLNCDAAEALRVIETTPFISRLTRRGLLEVL